MITGTLLGGCALPAAPSSGDYLTLVQDAMAAAARAPGEDDPDEQDAAQDDEQGGYPAGPAAARVAEWRGVGVADAEATSGSSTANP